MKQLVTYGGLGLLAYAVFLVAQTPADLVVAQARRYLPDLQVASVQGTILGGSARALSARNTSLEKIHWRWSPAGLLRGRWEYHVEAQEPGMEVSALMGVGIDGLLTARVVEGEVPFAKALSVALRRPLPLGGRVVLDLERMQVGLDGLPRAVEGMARLLDARTTVGRSLPLGNVAVELTTREEGIFGYVRDSGGPLEVVGTLTLDPQGRYRFSGQVGLRDQTEEELGKALPLLLGPPGADGKYQLKLSGQLRV